jgi:hypothetical protein
MRDFRKAGELKIYHQISRQEHSMSYVPHRPREDVFITLSGIARDDVSFGNGEAQYAM